MKLQQQFNQYVWLVNILNNEGRLTFEQLCERWQKTEMSGGMPLSRTTFNRMRDAILYMFGIIIECDIRDGYQYRIDNPDIMHCDIKNGHCIFAHCKTKFDR